MSALAAAKAARRWLLWKGAKVPYYADGEKRSGTLDTDEDRARLTTYEQATRAAERERCALGFALGPDGTGKCWQGIDLDKVSERPELRAFAENLIGYVESSPSGDGFHAIGYGEPFKALAPNGSHIEAYSKGRYFTFTGNCIRDGALVDLQPFVQSMLVPLHDQGSKTGKPISGLKNDIGSRNVMLFKFAGSLRRAGSTPEEIFEALRVRNRAHNPPLEADELRRIAHGIGRYTDGPALKDVHWTEPRPIKSDRPSGPEFDAAALLPPVLAEFVLDCADRMPCNPDFIAAPLLCALGSVIGARVALCPKQHDDWQVVPNTFCLIVGDPSSRKSPALAAVKRFLDALEAAAAEAQADTMKSHLAEMAGYEAHTTVLKHAMKVAAKGQFKADKIAEVVTELEQLSPPEPPVQRRYVSTDLTIEKLGALLADNPTGVMVWRDEMPGLLASFDRAGHESDAAFYLEGFNGTGSLSIDRIGRGSITVPNMCVSICGGIQPEPLQKVLLNVVNSLDNNGLMQRFQLLVEPEPVSWQWVDRYPVQNARQTVRSIFERLARMDPVADSGATPADEFIKLPFLRFDDEAQAIFIEWLTELHRERISPETNHLIQQHLAKYDKLFCAIALILHLAGGGKGSVQADSALRAAAWCQYLEGHARRVYGLVESAKVSAANMVGRRLVEGKLPDGFTARDVVRKGWAAIRSTLEAETALALLEEHGWVVSDELEGDVGRPTTRYYLNPKLLKEKP